MFNQVAGRIDVCARVEAHRNGTDPNRFPGKLLVIECDVAGPTGEALFWCAIDVGAHRGILICNG